MSEIKIQGDHGFIITDSVLISLQLINGAGLVNCYSLSGCIRDIIEGRLSVDQLNIIISSAMIENLEGSVEFICDSYKISWYANPNLAKEILTQLISQGRILQPMLEGKRRQIGNTQYTKAGWYEEHLDVINRVI